VLVDHGHEIQKNRGKDGAGHYSNDEGLEQNLPRKTLIRSQGGCFRGEFSELAPSSHHATGEM
jgi:hypothetical protein